MSRTDNECILPLWAGVKPTRFDDCDSGRWFFLLLYTDHLLPTFRKHLTSYSASEGNDCSPQGMPDVRK